MIGVVSAKGMMGRGGYLKLWLRVSRVERSDSCQWILGRVLGCREPRSIVGEGENFRSKAGWGSVGVETKIPAVGLEIGRVPGAQKIPFLEKSRVDEVSQGRSSKCRGQSPWAGIVCWGQGRAEGVLLSTQCV